MRRLLKPILLILFLSGLCLAQFRANTPVQSLPTNLNGELDKPVPISFLDPTRFDMQHGFTMSMMNVGGQSYSMAGYTNRLSYLVMDKLILDANVSLFKSQSPFQQNSLLGPSQYNIAYDAGIIYQPTQNSFLELRFRNFPQYQRFQSHSPFNPRIIE